MGERAGVSLDNPIQRTSSSARRVSLTPQIIDWLSPFVRRLQSIRYGWLIPVAILFVLSFPPLFGNEIVMVLVGIVWGLGVGFAITAVGIMLGEAANYLYVYSRFHFVDRWVVGWVGGR
jgi:uncharacterized membrane protein YdjX (TVP38/TMEM64 family)